MRVGAGRSSGRAACSWAGGSGSFVGSPGARRACAFGVLDPEAALRTLAESSVRKVVGHRGLESLLTKSRRDAEREALEELQSRVDRYGLGVAITAVAFQDVHPPLAVVDAYRDVSR